VAVTVAGQVLISRALRGSTQELTISAVSLKAAVEAIEDQMRLLIRDRIRALGDDPSPDHADVALECFAACHADTLAMALDRAAGWK
jgi:hypothetical protein